MKKQTFEATIQTNMEVMDFDKFGAAVERTTDIKKGKLATALEVAKTVKNGYVEFTEEIQPFTVFGRGVGCLGTEKQMFWLGKEIFDGDGSDEAALWLGKHKMDEIKGGYLRLVSVGGRTVYEVGKDDVVINTR